MVAARSFSQVPFYFAVLVYCAYVAARDRIIFTGLGVSDDIKGELQFVFVFYRASPRGYRFY